MPSVSSRFGLFLSASAFVAACGATSGPTRGARTEGSTGRESPSRTASPLAPSVGNSSAERPAPAPSSGPSSAAHSETGATTTSRSLSLPAAAFPPKDFPAPSATSAAPGDGHWVLLGDAALGERAASEPRTLARTVVHPHPESRYITVTIAALDLTHLSVALVPGTEDLAWAKLPVTVSSGLVPERDRETLVAVMNAGFQPKHGRWGLSANGVVVTPARKEGCTVAMYSDASIRIGPWPALADSAGNIQSYRQTPPCLIDGGVIHPALLKGLDKAWAGHAADLTTRRRSAIGIDESRTVLFYAIGEEASPRWLAEALRAAGAAFAAELDINWYWTRFLLFGTESGSLHVTSTLIPKMEHLRTEYVERASSRDFFYVTRRRPSHE